MAVLITKDMLLGLPKRLSDAELAILVGSVLRETIDRYGSEAGDNIITETGRRIHEDLAMSAEWDPDAD